MRLTPIARLASRCLALFALLAALPGAQAAPLAFDPTFGTGGKATTAISSSPSDEEARAVVLQPDGKTVVAGTCGGVVPYQTTEICVARFTNAGALDTTFGDRGTFNMPAPVGIARIRALALDGTKIVVAGSCGLDAAQDFCVLRLNANGTLDTTFNTTGIVVTPVGLLDDRAHAVAMVGTRIVVAGECEVSGSADMCLVRYDADGSLDATFGNGGKATFALSNTVDGAYALAVIDGLVYAGGWCGPFPVGFCAIRLTANGALDATWASSGKLYAYVGSNVSRVTALAASGSRLLLAGECSNGSNIDFCLLRLDYTTGQIDTTLNGNGIVIRPMGTGDDLLTGLTLVGGSTYLSGNCDSGGTKVFCLVQLTETGGISGSFNGGSPLLDPIGSTNAIATGLAPGFSTLTMAGTCGTFFTLDWCITRYSLAGQRDSSLATTGLVVKDLRVYPGNDQPISLLRQPDGKLLAAGLCSDDNVLYSRCVARYNPDGALDSGFGVAGIVLIPLGSNSNDAALAIDAASRIYVAGGCSDGTLFCVTRLLASGAVDGTYGTGGTASAATTGGYFVYDIQGVVLDADGAAVAGGHCGLPSGLSDYCAVKFTAAGALDTAFGTGGRAFVSVGSSDNAASFIANGTGFLISGDCFPGGTVRYCVVSLTANGQPDPAFGGGTGQVQFPMGSTHASRPRAALSAAGRIWLAGTCVEGGINQFCIARLMPDGSLDASFSGDGKASASVRGLDDGALSVLADGTGLLVGGSCRRTGATVVYDFCLARFLADGTLDPAFNDSGAFATPFGPADYTFSYGRALLRDGDRVVALVQASSFTLAAFALLPNDVPRAPTGVVATPGDGQASVAFVAPADNGGNAITSYQATCGDQSASGTASPLVVTGLTNGVAVTCTVTATNSAGTGPASAPPANVTPRKVTTVSMTTNANPSTSGNQIVLAATVTGQGPTGLVVFKDGGVTMPSGCSGTNVVAGVATCFTNALAVGTHNLTAEYEGDAANTSSISATYVQTVISSGFTLVAGPASDGSGMVNKGTVTSSPSGIDCGTLTSNCQASFANGTQVTLTATPDAGYAFSFWIGSCTGTGPCVVTMNANKSVSAVFVLATPVPRALTIVRNGTGTGSVASTPAGIACGATCSANFDDGTTVTLAATADAGSTFAGWTGGGCSGTGGCSVTLDAAKNVTATFLRSTFALTVSKAGTGTGLVTSTPSGIDCGATCSANFNSGASLALNAAPAAGSFFKGWSGACAGTGACNVTMDAAKSVGAEFKLNTTIPRLANISTRMQVLTGNDVMIGGFIIGGSVPKTVVVRARGPSLIPFGIPNALANPRMDLYSGQTIIATNDNWGDATNAAAITASGFAPTNALESAIRTTLSPGAYTAVVSGVGNGTGVGIVEVFEVDLPEIPLINISTRGQVLTVNDVMIGGFIIQGDQPQTVVIRARGPSLIPFGIPNALLDPVLQLFDGQTPIATNDDWQAQTIPADLAAIQASGFAPTDTREAVIRITLPPGAYTAIVTGKNNTTGVGIVEVFAQ